MGGRGIIAMGKQ